MLKQGERNHLKRPISPKESGFIVNNLAKQQQGQMHSLVNSTKHLRTKLRHSFQRMEAEELIPDSF